MSLADFARRIGITPATARQWKRRGKIVDTQAGYALVDREVVTVADVTAIERDGVMVAKRDNVTERDSVTVHPQGFIVTRDEFIALLSRVTELAAENAKLKEDVRTLYEDSAEYNKRIEALETENAERKAPSPLPPRLQPRSGLIDPPSSGWGA
jgi:hypothetical protein